MNKSEYLDNVEMNLKRMTIEQKKDIVEEIRQHIEDALSAGKDEATILSRLGDPKLLAKSLSGEFYAKNNNILKAIPFYITVGAGSFFMIFIFGGMAILFGAGVIGSIAGGIMRTFGNDSVNITMFNMDAPRALSIPVGLITAVFLFILVYLCLRVLKKYFLYISYKYKNKIY